MGDFEAAPLNRAQRRSMQSAQSVLPASAIKVTRFGDRVCVGIERPGHVRLTDVEAVELANAILRVAGEREDIPPRCELCGMLDCGCVLDRPQNGTPRV